MTRLKIAQTDSVKDAVVDIWEIRNKLADRGLVFYALAGLPTLAASVARALEFGWHPIYFYHLVLAFTTIACAVFRKRLPYSIRAGWLLSLSYLVGVIGLVTYGPASTGLMNMAMFTIMAAVALGWRAGLVTGGLSICTIIGLGLAVHSGNLVYSYDIKSYVHSPTAWASYAMSFLFWAPPAMIALSIVHSHLVDSQNALRKSQDYRKRLFDSSKIPTVVMDPDDHTFIDCNAAAVEVYGFSSSGELLGKTPVDVSPDVQRDGSDSEKFVIAYISRALSENDILFEWRHIRPSGEVWDAEIHLMRFESDGQKLLQCVVIDISRRKKAEEAWRRSQAHYQSLFNHANDAIFLLKEGRFVECNSKTIAMFHCTQESILGKTPQDFSPEYQPDGRLSEEAARERISKAIDSEPQIFEWKHRRRDGTLFDAEVSLNLLELDDGSYLLAIVRDITGRKQAEEELRRFALIVQQTAEIVMVTDTSGIINYVNRAFESVTGYAEGEAIGRNPSMLKSGKTPDSTYKELWETIMRGEIWKGRFINKTKDGRLFTEDATVSPLRDPLGEIISFVGVKRDISRELALENRINQAQKMEAIGALAGGIAHDFNNILTAVLGYTELATNDVAKDSKAAAYLDHVLKAGLRAKDLVGQILTFSRQTERERKPLRLHLVVKEALKLLRGSIPSTIEIRWNIDSSCAAVMANNTEIHQIIMNLCTNAYHAVPHSGGVIQVALSEVVIGKGELLTSQDLQPGKYVRLTVADNGHGIDEEIKNRIFEPYFTTKKRGEGTGLGLSTVHGIVKEMGGEISVYSEKDEGTTFNILMPAIETVDSSAGLKLSSMESLAGNERILVVDDEEPIILIAKEVLGSLGYHVTVSMDSAEALALFKIDPSAFDVIVTDQMMPNMRGTELSRELVAIRPDIPIILCTGFGDVLKEPESQHPTIRDYVMKPIVSSDLAGAIRGVLDGKRTGGKRESV